MGLEKPLVTLTGHNWHGEAALAHSTGIEKALDTLSTPYGHGEVTGYTLHV